MGLFSRLFGSSKLQSSPNDALFGAIKATDLRAVRDALARGAPVDSPEHGSALSYAILTAPNDIVNELLAQRFDPSFVVPGTMPPLVAAALKDRTDLLQLLLDKGARVDAPAQLDPPQTPLAFAVVRNSVAAATLLLKSGAKVDCEVAQPNSPPEDRGHTPLTWVSARGNLDLVRVLVEHGANVNHLTQAGMTPIFMAAWGGHTEIARLLIERGAIVDMASVKALNEGMIAPMVALMNGHRACYEVVRARSTIFRDLAFDDALAKYGPKSGDRAQHP